MILIENHNQKLKFQIKITIHAMFTGTSRNRQSFCEKKTVSRFATGSKAFPYTVTVVTKPY